MSNADKGRSVKRCEHRWTDLGPLPVQCPARAEPDSDRCVMHAMFDRQRRHDNPGIPDGAACEVCGRPGALLRVIGPRFSFYFCAACDETLRSLDSPGAT